MKVILKIPKESDLYLYNNKVGEIDEWLNDSAFVKLDSEQFTNSELYRLSLDPLIDKKYIKKLNIPLSLE
jgi:hypothetical protein